MTEPRTRRLLVGLATGMVTAIAMAGCSTGAGSGGGGSTTAESASAGGEAGVGADAPASQGRSAAAGVEAEQATALLDRKLIQRASLTVHARDVGTALARARTIVTTVRGEVAQEHTATDRRGEPRRSTLTLRVPVDSFDDVLAELAGLGRLGAQQVSTEDVSTEVVDVEARITSAERTIGRLRDLLEGADDFSDILSLEGELARREADLASLRAQQAYLQDQTSLSTIALTLLPRQTAPDRPDPEETGFVAGLGVGWDALVSVLTTLSTWLGVLLPLLVVLLPTGLVLWWVARRAARHRDVQPASPPAT